ncbi:VOC family protein [Mycolicibacterium arenosum]|uniref:VOC family protein n=1 Tax=Mycolicibacterium arenosum TaxID=2952157 RepID=A0ABT1M164_9MYCO|nr:VOC family protein [Mycolicibacterium sp. CAU 1645]MCP9272177.1 VOC family protein [Mycolicibacterium sp. CAU 1645]
MSFDHLLAVVPVSDIDTAERWYAKLFGRPADNNPMPALVEWQVVPGGWVQVFVDHERAGSGLLNFAVDDLAAAVDDATSNGLAPGAVESVNKGVDIARLSDPDGNTIALIGNFLVEY